jgi:hypothetical protein
MTNESLTLGTLFHKQRAELKETCHSTPNLQEWRKLLQEMMSNLEVKYIAGLRRNEAKYVATQGIQSVRDAAIAFLPALTLRTMHTERENSADSLSNNHFNILVVSYIMRFVQVATCLAMFILLLTLPSSSKWSITVLLVSLIVGELVVAVLPFKANLRDFVRNSIISRLKSKWFFLSFISPSTSQSNTLYLVETDFDLLLDSLVEPLNAIDRAVKLIEAIPQTQTVTELPTELLKFLQMLTGALRRNQSDEIVEITNALLEQTLEELDIEAYNYEPSQSSDFVPWPHPHLITLRPALRNKEGQLLQGLVGDPSLATKE